jgi:hypothetical protein
MLLTILARRAGALAALALSSLLLSACFVTSQNPVDGTGVDADPQLIGAWRGLDEDGKIEKGVFLHVIASKSGEGLGLALIDSNSFMILDGTTVQAGPHRFLNATLKDMPGTSDPDGALLGIHIIRYEVKGKILKLWLLSAAQITRAVEDGKLKGRVEGSGMSKTVRLTASSEELTAFFSKPDAMQYFPDKAASLVRFEN